MDGMTDSTRFPKLSDQDLDPAQTVLTGKIKAFSKTPFDGPFNILYRTPEAAHLVMAVSDYVRSHSAVPVPLAELAIMVHAKLWPDAHEWNSHEPRALAAGIAPEVLADLQSGSVPKGMSDAQSATYAFASEFVTSRSVSDASFAALKSCIGDQGVVDLTLLLAQYHLVSMLISLDHPQSDNRGPADAPLSGAPGAGHP